MDWECEARLSLESFPSGSRDAGVLLTGATGHVGACVLHRLLKISAYRPLSVLIRGGTEVEARSRLVETLQVRGYSEAALLVKSEVEILLGDLQAPNLGITAELASSLRFGTIIHTGAFVHHLHSYARLRPANVHGTCELLRLASSRPTRFVHLSTESARTCHSGYAQSKWVAARLVEQARDHGLDARIFPVGMVGPDSDTGAANTDDWLMRFVAGVIQLGAYSAPGSWR